MGYYGAAQKAHDKRQDLEIVTRYAQQFDGDVNTVQVSGKKWRKMVKLMQLALAGKRGPVTDADIGYSIPPGAKS